VSRNCDKLYFTSIRHKNASRLSHNDGRQLQPFPFPTTAVYTEKRDGSFDRSCTVFLSVIKCQFLMSATYCIC